MGNADSQMGARRHRADRDAKATNSPVLENKHVRVAKHRSLSPKTSVESTPRRTESFKNRRIRDSIADNRSIASTDFETLKRNRPVSRRAKSFRHGPHRSGDGSFRIPVCPITGLNVNQKKTLKTKWNDLDRSTIQDFARNIFETACRKDSRLLKVIGLERLTNDQRQSWKDHIRFRSHCQNFSKILSDVMKHLDEPQVCTDRLLEFGAEYALSFNTEGDSKYVSNVPSNYWDTLIFGFNNAAKDLQVESSRGSESPSLTTASSERRFLIPPPSNDDISCTNAHHHSNPQHSPSYLQPYSMNITNNGDTSPQAHLSPPIQQCCSRHGSNSAPILEIHNCGSCQAPPRSPMECNGSFTTSSTPSPCYFTGKKGFGFGTGSVCPIMTEAWNLLAVYVVGQMRFGYSMEILLQEQLKRLSASGEDENGDQRDDDDRKEPLKKLSTLSTTKTMPAVATLQAPPIYLQCASTLTEPVP